MKTIIAAVISGCALMPATSADASIDVDADIAYEVFLDAITSPESAPLFDGGWRTEPGLGGCVPAFGGDYMCVADTSKPGPDGEESRMLMAIVKPRLTDWWVGQIWVYDRHPTLSGEPGLTIDPPSVQPEAPLLLCEAGPFLSTQDGSVEEITRRAMDVMHTESATCTLVEFCTTSPDDAIVMGVISAAIQEQPEMYLIFASTCPGMLREAGIGMLGLSQRRS